MDVRNQWTNVKARSWAYANQDLFEADSSVASSFAQHGNIPGSELSEANDLPEYEMKHSGNVPEQELQDWVNGCDGRWQLGNFLDIDTGGFILRHVFYFFAFKIFSGFLRHHRK